MNCIKNCRRSFCNIFVLVFASTLLNSNDTEVTDDIHSLLGTVVKSNVIKYNSSASSASTKIIMFSIDQH